MVLVFCLYVVFASVMVAKAARPDSPDQSRPRRSPTDEPGVR